jgi:hypothetical protein
MTKREKLIKAVSIADYKIKTAEVKVKKLRIEYNKAAYNLQ